MSRDVKFEENWRWNWEKQEIEKSVNIDVVADSNKGGYVLDDDNIDELPVALLEICDVALLEICDVALLEPITFNEAQESEEWRQAMKTEVDMIKRNNKWTLVERPKNLKLLMALAAREGWRIWHVHVKSVFFNGLLTDDIFTEQPEGFIKQGDETKVCKLNKALYGLKQAPRSWYERINSYLYSKGPDGDDITEFKTQMTQEFDIIDLGEMSYFLGMEVIQGVNGMKIHQHRYAKDLLKRFKMDACKEVSTPAVFGNKLCKENGNPKVDEYLFRSMIGSFVQYSAKAEYIAATSVVNNALWLRKVLNDLGFIQIEGKVLRVDNQSTIAIAKNPIQHGRTKHTKEKFHAIHDTVKNDDIELEYCKTDEQVADILTKTLSKEECITLCTKLGVLMADPMKVFGTCPLCDFLAFKLGLRKLESPFPCINMLV
ncbi:Reverse transcriptase [Theobroma cacao]|nr:Reverse transcriptase [Theobroma cacao]